MISCSDRVQFYIMVEVVESHEHALILLFKVMVEVVESHEHALILLFEVVYYAIYMSSMM